MQTKNNKSVTIALVLAALLSSCLISQAVFAAGQPLQIIWQQTGHSSGTSSVEFSPGGQLLVSGGAYCIQSGAVLCYGEVKTWTAQDGTLLAATPQDQSLGGVNEVSFSPDGQTAATANGSIYCTPDGGCGSVAPGLADYSVPQLMRLDLAPTNPINATIDYSADGQLLATGEFYGDFQIRIRNAADLSVIRTLPGHDGGFGSEGTFSLRFSPDGTLLASGGADGLVKIFRVSDGVLLRTLPLADVITIAFSPNGQLIAAGNVGLLTINVWRVADGSLVKTFSFPGGQFGTAAESNLAWTPSGAYLVGGTTVLYEPLTIRFWNVTTGKLAGEFTDNTDRAISSIAFTPNGRRFAYGASEDVVVARTPRLP